MRTRLVDTVGDNLELYHEDRLLFRYVYVSKARTMESPRPYFHPLRTLGGETVTIFRPHDHLWHHGLSMTSAHLSGENFWGGPTFVRERGYVYLDNNGRTDHESWPAIERAGALPLMVERLRWVTQDGRHWLQEQREIEIAEIDAESGHWAVRFGFHLRNVSGHAVDFGSPTTAGRPAAGYGGLFWRGPREWLGCRIIGAGSVQGPRAMGERSPWLALSGRHDGSANASTVVLADHAGNPRYPTKWFVRNDPYACASCAFMFDEEYRLEPDRELALRYLVMVADGEWDPERIDACVNRLQAEIAPVSEGPPATAPL